MAIQDKAVYCDVNGASADAATVQALARLQLAARRRGGQIVLRGASVELRRLIDFMGLAQALPIEPVEPVELRP